MSKRSEKPVLLNIQKEKLPLLPIRSNVHCLHTLDGDVTNVAQVVQLTDPLNAITTCNMATRHQSPVESGTAAVEVASAVLVLPRCLYSCHFSWFLVHAYSWGNRSSWGNRRDMPKSLLQQAQYSCLRCHQSLQWTAPHPVISRKKTLLGCSILTPAHYIRKGLRTNIPSGPHKLNLLRNFEFRICSEVRSRCLISYHLCSEQATSVS